MPGKGLLLMNTKQDKGQKLWSTPLGITLGVFLAVAAVLLWLEHRAHILGALPLLLPLLICIGMHFFLHGKHGGRGGHDHDHNQKGGRDGQ